MRRTGILLALALTLGAPPFAAAKNLTRAEVCGQSGCAELARDKSGDGLIQLRGSEGRELSPPPLPAPYYRLIWEFTPPGGGPSVRNVTLYVLSADLIAAEGMSPGSVEWFGASEAVLDKVRTAIEGLEPFAAPYGWKASLLAAPQLTPNAPAAESRDWTRWVLAAALVLLAAAGFLSLRLRLRRPLLHRSFSG
jgi:hypothetical protein